MTTTPVETSAVITRDTSEEEMIERPRFAAQRMRAAHIGRFPVSKVLVDRARSEGRAHRRRESAEQPALPAV
jgi:hypothetical protein